MDTYSEEYRHACECKSWAKRALRQKEAGKDVQSWWVEIFELIKKHRGPDAAVHLEQGVHKVLRESRDQLLEEIRREREKKGIS